MSGKKLKEIGLRCRGKSAQDSHRLSTFLWHPLPFEFHASERVALVVRGDFGHRKRTPKWTPEKAAAFKSPTALSYGSRTIQNASDVGFFPAIIVKWTERG